MTSQRIERTWIRTGSYRGEWVKYYRDYSNFDEESYLQDINAVNWNAIYSNDLHETATKITDLIKSVSDKHAPIRQLSQKKQKLCTKLWITNGILKSNKTKPKLYNTHFLSNNPIKVTEYKRPTFHNTLTHVKTT